MERQLFDQLSAGADRRPIYERLARHYTDNQLPADAFHCLKWLLAHAPDAAAHSGYLPTFDPELRSFSDLPPCFPQLISSLTPTPASWIAITFHLT